MANHSTGCSVGLRKLLVCVFVLWVTLPSTACAALNPRFVSIGDNKELVGAIQWNELFGVDHYVIEADLSETFDSTKLYNIEVPSTGFPQRSWGIPVFEEQEGSYRVYCRIGVRYSNDPNASSFVPTVPQYIEVGSTQDQTTPIEWIKQNQMMIGASGAGIILLCVLICCRKRICKRNSTSTKNGDSKKNKKNAKYDRDPVQETPDIDAEMVPLGIGGGFGHLNEDSEEEDETVTLISIDDIYKDPTWFQSTWISLSCSRSDQASLSDFMLIDLDMVESALNRRGFNIIASGAPSETEIKIYFVGVVKKKKANVECLCELIVDTKAHTVSIQARCEKKYRSVLTKFMQNVMSSLSNLLAESSSNEGLDSVY